MVKKNLCIFYSLLAVLFFTCNVNAAVSDVGTNMDADNIAKANSGFAFDLYGKLKSTEGNIFFSPYSISTALGMAYAGARGNTARQMANVLNFDLGQDRIHPTFFALQVELNDVQKKGKVKLSIANALWIQKDYVFLKEFFDICEANYEAGLNQVDFANNTEGARIEINKWVENKTQDKIKNLIQKGILDPSMSLVLTNAIYFKGDWANEFKKGSTTDRQFWISADEAINVPMMAQKSEFGYVEKGSLKILEMPYAGNDLSMVVILPDKKDGLPDVESMLNEATVTKWLAGIRGQEVDVSFPKFKMASAFELADTLSEMGMRDAFSSMAADFSGMTGTRDLYISKVIHKAFVAVDEKGTEAAAATAVIMKRGIAMPEKMRVFNADHPFIFLIKHNKSGSILFAGRVVDPRK